MTQHQGPILSVDVGSVRTGVAVSDPRRTVALPLATVAGGPATVSAVLELVAEREAGLVVVGWPLSLSGQEGRAAVAAREVAELLAGAIDIPVVLVDERFTTHSAAALVQQSGRRGSRGRAVVDQAAALVLLQHVIDAAASGTQVGVPVTGRAGAA